MCLAESTYPSGLEYTFVYIPRRVTCLSVLDSLEGLGIKRLSEKKAPFLNYAKQMLNKDAKLADRR